MNENQPKIDITGTMAKGIDNWQERTERLAKPEFWTIECKANVELWLELSDEERQRMGPKIDMVIMATKHMLAGMVKGTVKYTSDDWSLDRWMAHMVGEGYDQLNYQMLLFTSFQKEKEHEQERVNRIRKTWEEKDNVSSDDRSADIFQRDSKG